MLNKDSLKLGIVLGLLAPLLGLLVFYFINFYPNNMGFLEYLVLLKEFKSALTLVSSVSLIANAFVFTIYINKEKDNTAKGIFVATIIYAIAILIIKLAG